MNALLIKLKSTEIEKEIIPETIEVENIDSEILNGEIVVTGICSCKLKFKASSKMVIEQAI